MTKDDLLKEADDLIRERSGYYYERGVPHQSSLPHCMCRDCIDSRIKDLHLRITAALSAPSLSSVELVRQIREGFIAIIPSGNLAGALGQFHTLSDSAAASLIDGIRKQELSEDEMATIKMAIILLNEFDHEADEDSCAGMSFFKARTSEDEFFAIKDRLRTILINHKE